MNDDDSHLGGGWRWNGGRKEKKKKEKKERKLCVNTHTGGLDRFIAPSLHGLSLHHRVREGNGQQCPEPTEQ